ncbi:MAG: ElyC/SanA/YdcF family protein [Cyanobacteria bacterium P01_D01_bin.115]
MVLNLLTRILVWAAFGLLIWYFINKIVPKNFLTVFGGAIILALIFLSFAFTGDPTISAIRRIISFPLTPLGATITILLFSFRDVSFENGFKKINGQWVAIAFVILVVSSLPLVARVLVNQAEQSVQRAYAEQQGICQDVCPADIPEAAPLGQIVGLVVLGDNMDAVRTPAELSSRIENTVTPSPAASLSPILLSRLDSASRLYGRVQQAGGAPFVMVTAGPVVGNSERRTQKEQVLRQVLVNNGVPDAEISVNRNGLNAREAMKDAQDLLEERGQLDGEGTRQLNSNRVAIVAPALTMRRAALTFEEGDLQVVAWPTNFYGSDFSTDDTLALLSDLVPNVEALRLTTAYVEETTALIGYFLRGWLPEIDSQWSEIVELVPQ